MEGITNQYIVDYINSVQPQWEAELSSLEEYAKLNNVPIIQKEASRFLYNIGRLKKPKRILEIGTAIGYSAIILSKTLSDGGEIVTIERSDKMYAQAEENIQKFKLQDTIKLYHGDALDIIGELQGKFDMVFIDAAKGQYSKFLDDALKLIDSGAVIVSDNVLFKGKIASPEKIERRNRTIFNRLREYLDRICNSGEFETSIIPIGDGIAVSIKR